MKLNKKVKNVGIIFGVIVGIAVGCSNTENTTTNEVTASNQKVEASKGNDVIEEQEKVLHNDKKNMLVSASAGSGKTYIMIKYITKLICEDRIPVNNLLVLTFTKAAATEMKERLQKRLQEMGKDKFVVEQIDSLSTANISTIHAFCEKNLKKYANLLGINENFAIADENLSQKIRQNAFDIALKKFNEEFENEYYELISNFKNNKSKLQEIMFEINNSN